MTKKKTSHPMFRRWCMLKFIIAHQDEQKYKAYKGVSLHREWYDFWTFAAYIEENWELPPVLDRSIIFDRIDNSKDYVPGNVRFTDVKGNSNDRASTRLITYKKKTQSLADWSVETGVPFKTLFSRIEHGWPLDQAFGYKARTK